MKLSRFLPGLVAAMILTAGCASATVAPDDVREPDTGAVVYDVQMLERDGVLSVRNNSGHDIDGVAFSFVPKRDLYASAFSDRVSVSDDGYVHIAMDEAPAGGESVLDMSGFLHMYWSKDCDGYFSYAGSDGGDVVIQGG